MEGDTMKVIFIRDLKGQGKKGEIKEVKDGYGNNFLIKNGYAVLANSSNMTKLKNEEARRGIEETLKVHDMEDLKKEIELKTFEFKAKTGKEGKMFGQISVKQIKEVERGRIKEYAARVSGSTYTEDVNCRNIWKIEIFPLVFLILG